MDLDDELRASDPATDLTPGARAAVVALVADAESAAQTRPRGRRLAVAGGVAGAVLVGAGVANAAGVPVLGIGHSHPQPSCTVSLVPTLSGVRRAEIKIRRGNQRIVLLQNLMATQDPSAAPPTLVSPRLHGLRDLVQRMNAAQKAVEAAQSSPLGSACPTR